MRRLLLIIIVLVVAACTSTETAPRATSLPAAADVPRPQEPATGDDFRADHPSHVASTGQPQLIEFYSDT